MSHVTCHVSHVMCHIFSSSFQQVLKLFAGGSVINGARQLISGPVSASVFSLLTGQEEMFPPQGRIPAPEILSVSVEQVIRQWTR